MNPFVSRNSGSLLFLAVASTGLLTLLLSLSRTYENNASMSKEMKQLRQSSTRIWHDAVQAITAIRSTTRARADLKASTLTVWRVYGSFFGLVSGTGSTTLDRPSELSEDLRYWRIPRRCSRPACVCAYHSASHSVRVCKGCWRVLYCNKQCQQA